MTIEGDGTLEFTYSKTLESYYEETVAWAVENDITNGTSDTTFSTDATCTRTQIVTVLWCSQESPAAGAVNPFAYVKADDSSTWKLWLSACC